MGAEGTERLFVYGTLRRGGTRDAAKFFPGVTWVGPARIRGRLHDFGAYPGLRLDGEAGWVQGELLDANAEALIGMDAWEGIGVPDEPPGEYLRVRTEAERAGGEAEICWVYEVSAEACRGRAVIAAGDWLAHSRAA